LRLGLKELPSIQQLTFHKEKEMVAFRKLSPVLAVFALMLGAQTVFAQGSTGLPLQCTANAGVPPVVRAEGFTELTGDLVVTCTGGNPALPFNANIQVFLNTNITSRILDTSTGATEALLMLDEPGLPRTTGNATPFCVSPSPASNPILNPTCNPTGTGQTYQQGSYTVFRGTQQINSQNILVWAGVPITPPGTTGSRTIRITNVRANAAGLGASQTLIPTQIVAYISVFPQGTLPIDNPQQTVGYVQQGLLFDVRNCGNTDVPSTTGGTSQLQCRGVNTSQFTTPTSGTIPSGSTTSAAVYSLRFREGFQTAFKPQIIGAGPSDPNGQYFSQPGQVFNSESGFVRNDPALAGAGIANSGTRLSARFVNIPTNLRLFVSTTQTNLSTSGVAATLISVTDPTGAGGTTLGPVTGGVTLSCSATGATTTSAVEVPVIAGSTTTGGTAAAGTATAVWEVTQSNPSQNDTFLFYFSFAYVANQNAGAPGLGVGQVIGNLAPFYPTSTTAAGQASSALNVPRFAQSTTTATNLFTISQCQTNLLFPFVTNQAGFDTGIAITNTSADPLTSGSPQGDPARLNSGQCTLSYYGRLANGQTPTNASETTSSPVTTDQALTMVLSSGGNYGLRGNANFQGYIIAQCNFLFAHGFAFITDGPIGQARVAEGYLALVLDGPNTVRGNSIGESVGN